MLAIRHGTVILYDDTAMKKRYRLPLGVGAVIDGEYYTRIAFQTIAADTGVETCEWVLQSFLEAREMEAPDVFIQGENNAMAGAAEKVFPLAKKRRCVWRLRQNVAKNLTGLLGNSFEVSI